MLIPTKWTTMLINNSRNRKRIGNAMIGISLAVNPSRKSQSQKLRRTSTN